MCLIDFDKGSNSPVVADLRDLVAAQLNCPCASLSPKNLEEINVVMAVTNETFDAASKVRK